MSSSDIPLADLLSDPDRTLEVAREAGPCVHTEMGPLMVRHAAVRELAQSDKVRPSFTQMLEGFGVSSGPFYDWMRRSPLDMEGDEHRAWRALMAKTFTPRSVERLRRFLGEQAERLVDSMLPAGRCDFVRAFARQLPSLGLCELIGVPPDDRLRFSDWADIIGLGFNPGVLAAEIGRVDAALLQLLAYTDELIAARRAEPRDDLVSRLSAAADQQGGLDPELVRASIAGLVFAGHETTKNQLGWMIVLLSKAPAEWDRVAIEPERARDVVEEVLRLRSTATLIGRLVLAPPWASMRTIPCCRTRHWPPGASQQNATGSCSPSLARSTRLASIPRIKTRSRCSPARSRVAYGGSISVSSRSR
jgi:cytochrome P450